VRVESSTAERRRRAASFDEDAEKYDRARATYPAELFDEVWRLAEPGPAPDVVEVGCATGQASIDLAKRAGTLTCVDFGENMVELARRKLSQYPNTRVVRARFEEWDPGEQRFDLAFAASSWHWLEPNVRFAKAAEVLKPGGSVAVVHTDHHYPEGFDPLYPAIQDVYGSVTGTRLEVKEQQIPAPGLLETSQLDQIAELHGTGAYDKVRVARVLWSIERTADAYIDLLGTYSDHWAMEPDKRERLFAGIHRLVAQSPSGTIRKHCLSTVLVATVKPA